MSEFITLTCPSCGGKLLITNDIERFACAHCGTEMLVRRGEGVISLKPVFEEVKGVRRAADHTAAELAMVRIQKEIDELIIYRDSLPAPENEKSFFATLAIFLFIGSFVIFLIYSSSDIGTPICLIPLVLGIGFTIIARNGQKKAIERGNPQQKEVNLRIAQKQSELNRYKNIVNSY